MDGAPLAFDVLRLENGNRALVQFIADRIRTHGPVTFAWFMEQALYHAEWGYYSSCRAVIGRGGDYFTNVSVGPVFGELMAAQFAGMWDALGRPGEFTIVEQGAHDGQFAHDTLAAAQRAHPELFAALCYRIVEPFAACGFAQIEKLTPFAERVRWVHCVEALEPFCGVQFSNELLDAVPVHVVRWTGAEWVERCVAQADGDPLANSSFRFVDEPIADGKLREHLALLPTPETAGYETEVNLATLDWVDGVARKLATGFVLAIDYGFARSDFYAPHRTSGTLQCYAAHRVLESPLMNVGEADITAHVEWTSVAHRAEANGLRLLGFTDQHHFIAGLLGGGYGDELLRGDDPSTQRQLQTLLHPGLLGMKFQFLGLSKGIDSGQQLAGFKFARDSRATLELSS